MQSVTSTTVRNCFISSQIIKHNEQRRVALTLKAFISKVNLESK